MFKRNDPTLQQLDKTIEEILNDMQSVTSDDPVYNLASDQYVKLMKLRAEISAKGSVSPDVVAGILGNLGVVGLILWFERSGPIVSKALSFVQKLR